MSNRTAFPGTSTTGITHTAAHDNDLPGGWIGYVQVTADQTAITSETDLTGLSQAVTVNTSRRIMITAEISYSCSSGAANRAVLRIKESTTVLQARFWSPGTNGTESATATVILTPSSGSHTYKLSLQQQDAGNVNLLASAGNPSYLLIEDIGPA